MADEPSTGKPRIRLRKERDSDVDLGAIEATLKTCPGVHQAVVIEREDSPGEKRVVAYVVGDVPAVALRAHFRGTPPDVMVPDAFVTLGALPLAEDGKVHVDALPPPEAVFTRPGYVPPRGVTEEALARLWMEMLDLDRVSSNDNFFDLGGNSLVAMRLMGRVADEFGCELPLRALLEAPTISALARQIGYANEEATWVLLDGADGGDERNAQPEAVEQDDTGDGASPGRVHGADPTRLMVVADLDAVPAEVVTRLLSALDGVHRAWGGDGLELESVDVGTASEAGVRA